MFVASLHLSLTQKKTRPTLAHRSAAATPLQRRPPTTATKSRHTMTTPASAPPPPPPPPPAQHHHQPAGRWRLRRPQTAAKRAKRTNRLWCKWKRSTSTARVTCAMCRWRSWSTPATLWWRMAVLSPELCVGARKLAVTSCDVLYRGYCTVGGRRSETKTTRRDTNTQHPSQRTIFTHTLLHFCFRLIYPRRFSHLVTLITTPKYSTHTHELIECVCLCVCVGNLLCVCILVFEDCYRLFFFLLDIIQKTHTQIYTEYSK